jgi:hypothetical protein
MALSKSENGGRFITGTRAYYTLYQLLQSSLLTESVEMGMGIGVML